MNRLMCLIALISSGCATTARYNEFCGTHVGKSEEALISSIGVPDSSYETNGTKYLKYKKESDGAILLGGVVASAEPCVTTYIVKNGIVDSYSFKGDECQR
jgi:hypothetical protein